MKNDCGTIKLFLGILGSRHSSYTSHQSRISYTSHGDLLGTKEQKLRSRSSRNQSMVQPTQGVNYSDTNHKGHREYVIFLNHFYISCVHCC